MNRATAKVIGLSLAMKWCDRNGWSLRQIMSSGYIYAPYIPMHRAAEPVAPDPAQQIVRVHLGYDDTNILLGPCQAAEYYEAMSRYARRHGVAVVTQQQQQPVLGMD
jgi:hypothetical protein